MSRTSNRLLATAGLSGLLLATAGLPAFASTDTAAATKPAAGCSAGKVATAVDGNPRVKAGATEGFYVFHDSHGYEIKVTHPRVAPTPGETKKAVAAANKEVFAGSMTASKGFAKLKDVKLEGGDFATESADHKTIVFRLTDYGYIDGFHAFGDCSASVKVSLRIDGKTATTSQVFLGKSRGNPTSVPFTIDRSKSTAGVATTPTNPAAASA